MSTNTTPPVTPVFAPQPAPKKKHRIRNAFLLIVGAIIAIAVIVNLGNGGDDTATTTPTDGNTAAVNEDNETAEPAADDVAGLNSPVRDGKFEFVVTKIETGVPSIGSDILEETAQGQFVVIDMTIENVGDEAQYLMASDQYLFDVDGKEYSASDSAWMALENNPLLEEINPGNKIDGTVVFDVPEGVELTELELHDSAFSGGVRVAVK